MNVLVVAAHPDDEVLGCGGTIARLACEGHTVSILIMGEGITSRYGNPDEAHSKELEALHQQARNVGASLGAREVILAKLPDNRFDTIPLLDVIKIIEREIQKGKPDVVYTQHGGDLNVDHATIFRAVLTATRPLEGCSVKKVYAYEVLSSTEWSFQKFAPVFCPNVFMDISATLEKKLAAIRVYTSEARPFPHPRSPEALCAAAEHWGSVVGVKAAEAFELVREMQ